MRGLYGKRGGNPRNLPTTHPPHGPSRLPSLGWSTPRNHMNPVSKMSWLVYDGRWLVRDPLGASAEARRGLLSAVHPPNCHEALWFPRGSPTWDPVTGGYQVAAVPAVPMEYTFMIIRLV